jgi:hypothetical protein
MVDLETLMRPGNLSGEGFLGPTESLDEVLAEDDKTVKELGLTHEQIADRIGYFVKKYGQLANNASGEQGWDEYDKVIGEGYELGKYRFKVEVWRGAQECPWKDGVGSNTDYVVTNTETGESIEFPGLIEHLIRAHHFYEGKGTSYRLDPAEAARILEIKPDERY